MNTELLKLLKKQIKEIDHLKSLKWICPEYDIWKNTTSKIMKDLFGDEYFKLFNEHLSSAIVISENESQNQRWYIEGLENIKKLLMGFIEEREKLKKNFPNTNGDRKNIAERKKRILYNKPKKAWHSKSWMGVILTIIISVVATVVGGVILKFIP